MPFWDAFITLDSSTNAVRIPSLDLGSDAKRNFHPDLGQRRKNDNSLVEVMARYSNFTFEGLGLKNLNLTRTPVLPENRHNVRRRLIAEELASIRVDYEARVSIDAIAEKYGVRRNTIRLRLKAMGIQRKQIRNTGPGRPDQSDR